MTAVPRPLTERQREILAYLESFSAEHGYAPTMREIADHFGWTAPHSAVDHVEALERKGYVTRQAGQARTIVLVKAVPRG